RHTNSPTRLFPEPLVSDSNAARSSTLLIQAALATNHRGARKPISICNHNRSRQVVTKPSLCHDLRESPVSRIDAFELQLLRGRASNRHRRAVSDTLAK